MKSKNFRTSITSVSSRSCIPTEKVLRKTLHPVLPVWLTVSSRIIFFLANVAVQVSVLRNSLLNYAFFSFWVQIGQFSYSILLLWLEACVVRPRLYCESLFAVFREISLFVLGTGPVILFIFYTFWRPFAVQYYGKDRLFLVANECVHLGFVVYLFAEYFFLQRVLYFPKDLQLVALVGSLYVLFNSTHYFCTRNSIYKKVINFGDGVISRWFIFFVITFVSLLFSLLCVFWSERRLEPRRAKR